MAHEIRLAGPWEVSADQGTSWQRCTLPVERGALNAPEAADYELRRKFHRPSGLDESSQVFIRFESIFAVNEIQFNDELLAQILPTEKAGVFDIDVTSMLVQFNTLLFRVSPSSANCLQEVRVRIVEGNA